MGEVPNAILLKGVSVRFGCQHGLRLTTKVKLARYYNALCGHVAHRGGLAPPIGDDPTHKPLKTRLSSDFSSCNRRILVYGLVYDQDPRECHTPPYGYHTCA